MTRLIDIEHWFNVERWCWNLALVVGGQQKPFDPESSTGSSLHWVA